MKLTMIALLLMPGILSPAAAAPETAPTPDSGETPAVVMFWNLENFFEPGDTAASPYWTARRFRAKCNGIAKTILEAADHAGKLPDAIGFAEVGNAAVLRRLINGTILGKTDYRIVHYDSPDRRGIDCALLYRSTRLSLRSSSAEHLRGPDGETVATRDILVCVFDSLALLVNHHPSKLGSGAADRRAAAMSLMQHLGDSLAAEGIPSLCVGDFNDTLWGKDLPGTIKYNGVWEKIDGGFGFGGLQFRDEAFCSPSLLVPDRSHGGLKPRRTFNGPKYIGGISDHLPVIYYIYKLKN